LTFLLVGTPVARRSLRERAAHAVDRGQADDGVLMIWDINPCNTCHSLFLAKLTLTLLVTRLDADHADHAFALDDLAVAADPLD
jgi:hypothetical protein